MSLLEVRVRDHLARNGTDVTLGQVAACVGATRAEVADVIGRLDLDHLSYGEAAPPKPKARPGLRKRARGGRLTARAATGRRSDCPCDGDRCRIDVGDDRHGTLNGYGNHRCRCRACRDANRDYYRERNRRPASVYAPAPRFCANCAMRVPEGKGRRHGRCEPCARYFDRNGRERPERLWRANVGADTASRTDTPDTATSTKTEPVGTGVSRGMPSPARGSAGTAPTPDPTPPAPEPASEPAPTIATVPCAICRRGAAADAPKRIPGVGKVCRRCWREHGGDS